MQATYHIKPNDLDHFLRILREAFKDKEELTITVASNDSKDTPAAEREKAFYDLFGSWLGDETGDELVSRIYEDRVNSTKDIDL